MRNEKKRALLRWFFKNQSDYGKTGKNGKNGLININTEKTTIL